jgi:DNA-binding NarL/FixJ family response regulator
MEKNTLVSCENNLMQAPEITRDAEFLRGRGGEDLSVLLLDRRPMLRDCVARALATVDTGVDVHQASGSRDDGAPAGGRPPSVCILATGSLPLDDEWIAGELRGMREAFPDTPVAILADVLNLEDVVAALKLGVRGYFTTEMDLRIVVEAARLIRRGGVYVPAEALLLRREVALRSDRGPRSRRGSARGTAGDGSGNPMATITPREFDVLMRLRQGKPNKVIAFELEMCESTVKVHVQSIMRKLGARNRTQVTYLTQTVA